MQAARAIPWSAVLLLAWGSAGAYPEYQAWSQKTSGRFVNCAMCHAHPDGPEGVKPGQLGSLSPQQWVSLNEARAAHEPGTTVHSPILNEFGNDLVRQLGRREIIALRLDPAALVGRIDVRQDHDNDGIPDAHEYRDGTDPLDAQSGDPWVLFKTNFARQRFHIAMILLATASGVWGLTHLLRGLHAALSRNGARATRTNL